MNFTNQRHILATDMWDFPARELHPTQGRWISPDPAGLAAVDITDPQTWNRYAYVRNNPCSFVDPLGLDSCNFNIAVNTDGWLNAAQVSAFKAEFSKIFATAKGRGELQLYRHP